MIPLFATRPAVEPLLAVVAERQRAVLESGRYILGPEVEAFESEFASYIDRRHCVGVASGTDALTIALRALGVREGDEVIVPGISFFATAEAVVNAGARPVFADIDPSTYCLTAEAAEEVITDRVRAIVPVHLFGNPATTEGLLELARARGVRLLEDAAQAAGARIYGTMAGSLGDAAAFSFYPGKNLGAFGDAGAILTDDDEVAAVARRLRVHGTLEGWVHTEVGLNSRLDELQAAGLRALLPHLDGWVEARRRAASAYHRAGVSDLVTAPTETEGAEAAYHLYVIRTRDRDLVSEALRREEVETRAYYTTPLHRQPAMREYAADRRLPNSERLATEGLALPMGPALDDDAVTTVVQALARALRRNRGTRAGGARALSD